MVTGKGPFPKCIAEHGEVARSRTILFGGKGASTRGGKTEEMEIIRRHLRPLNLLRRIDASQIHRAVSKGGNVIEQASLLAPHIESGRRGADRWSFRPGCPEHDDAVGIRSCYWLQQNRVHD